MTVASSRSRLTFVATLAIVAMLCAHVAVARASDVDDCGLVSASEIGDILGYPVEAPDETSRVAGICFFTSRAISQDGSVTYAFVTRTNLAQRRSFAAARARLCAGVAKNARNALVCKAYADLALAPDLDAYFIARTSETDAVPVRSLGPDAIAAPDALYVRRDDRIIEVVVRRGETLDVDRETALAEILLERVSAR